MFMKKTNERKSKGQNFFEDVYAVVKLIPKGRVTSYGAIAQYLGTKMSARMVGWALNGAFGKDVPAHRVVNRVGMLTAKHHFKKPNTMKRLLEQDGIRVINDKIVDFTEYFWNPCQELL
jgi:methylated-DNA-protein-cysteine methyltransferase related protein